MRPPGCSGTTGSKSNSLGLLPTFWLADRHLLLWRVASWSGSKRDCGQCHLMALGNEMLLQTSSLTIPFHTGSCLGTLSHGVQCTGEVSEEVRVRRGIVALQQ